MNVRPSTPARLAALGLLALLVLSTMPLDPAQGMHAAGMRIQPVPVGGWLNLTALDLKYVGTADAPLPCLESHARAANTAECEAFPAQRRVSAWTSRDLPGASEARAGVGFAYEFQKLCVGQRPGPSAKLLATVGYSRSVNAMAYGGGVRTPVMEIWEFPTMKEDQRPGATQEALNPNNRTETFTSTQPARGVMKALPATQIDTFEGTLHYALYARVSSTTAVAQQTVANVEATVEWVNLSWLDMSPPTVAADWQTASGSKGFTLSSPVAGPVVRWFNEPVTLELRPDDNFSCPKTVYYQENDGPVQTFSPGYTKEPLRISKSAEGRWKLAYWADDHSGRVMPKETVEFGIDTTLPEVPTTVSGPDGDDGWYRTNPSVTIECVDAGSGCWQGNYWYDAGSKKGIQVFPRTMQLTEEGEHVFHCEALDKSNLAAPGCGFAYKLDRTAPGVGATCESAATGDYFNCPKSAGEWFRTNQWVHLSCHDGLSGCSSQSRDMGEGPMADYGQPFSITGEGHHSFVGSGRDRAGNVKSETFWVNIDWTPPAPVTVEERNLGRDPVPDQPYWTFLSSDALSGPRFRESVVWGDGTPDATSVWVADRSATAQPATRAAYEGRNCVIAHVQDAAGNPGVSSEQSCVRVDVAKPVLTVLKPQKNKAYHNDAEFAPLAADQVLALGPITFTANAKDQCTPGRDCGAEVASMAIRMSGDIATCLVPAGAQDVTCSRTFVPTWAQFPAEGVIVVRFEAEARDVAGHAPSTVSTGVAALPDVFALSLLSFSGKNDLGLPEVRSMWLPYADSAPFVRYEVYRADELTPNTWVKMTTITNPSITSYADNSITPDRTYKYKVTVVTRDANQVEQAKSSNSYRASYSSGGGSGGCGGPLGNEMVETSARYESGLCDFQMREFRMADDVAQ